MALYYVKTGGDDSRDGQSDANAWATLAKVSAFTFQAGDTIQLKRGSVWRELLTVPRSSLTFTAYGTGAKPQILGSTAKSQTSDWTSIGSNLWTTTIATDPKLAWRDGVRLTKRSSGNPTTTSEWLYSGTTVTVFATSNPATGHTFEFAARNNAVTATARTGITLDNLDCRYAQSVIVNILRGSGTCTLWHVTSCDLAGSWHDGLLLGSDSNALGQTNGFLFSACTVADCGGDSADDINQVRLFNCNDFVVEDSTFTASPLANNGYSYGLVLRVTSSTAPGAGESRLIRRNTFNGQHTNGQGNIALSGANYITIGGSEGNGNTISATGGVGIRSDETSAGADDGSFNCTISHNTYIAGAEPGGPLIFWERSHNSTFHHNVLDARLSTGWRCCWFRGTDNINIYNNVLLLSGSVAGIYAGWGSDPAVTSDINNIIVKNNIFHRPVGTSDFGFAFINFDNSDHLAHGCAADYNQYYTANGATTGFYSWFGTVGGTLASFQTRSQEAHGQSGNPLFTNLTTRDLTLQSGSPCIDTGVVISGVTDGYSGSAPDIGRFEFGTAPPVPYTLVPVSTVLAGSWVDQNGSNTDLHSPLADEDAETWIVSPLNSPGGTTVKLGLTDPPTVVGGDVIITLDAVQIEP